MHRAGSYGLARALVERFADGEWHWMYEAVADCGPLIPGPIAIRRADRARQPADIDADLDGRLARGRRLILGIALQSLGAEAGGPKGRRWQRFRLAPGSYGFQYGPRIGVTAPAKLTDDEVREVRRRHAEGASYGRLARELGLSRARIGELCAGKTYRDVV